MAKDGQMLQVHYKGALTASGEVFDDADLVFPLGRGHVIKGWDAGPRFKWRVPSPRGRSQVLGPRGGSQVLGTRGLSQVP